MTDLQNPTEGTPETAPIPETPGEATTSTPGPNPEQPATVQATTVIPQPIKETFFQKLEVDAEDAWHWLEKEISKL